MTAPQQSSARDPYAVPETYEELFRQYGSFVTGMVIKLGIAPKDAQDVSQDIFVRLLSRDILMNGELNTDPDDPGVAFTNGFDPEKVIVHSGETFRARYQSWLGSMVEAYVRGHRDRLGRIARREPLIIDAPVGDESQDSWLDVFATDHDHAYVDDGYELEEKDLVERVVAYLTAIPRRSKQDQMDLPLLFTRAVEMVRRDGLVDRKELAKSFGVSSTAIGSWMTYLRKHLKEMLAAQDEVEDLLQRPASECHCRAAAVINASGVRVVKVQHGGTCSRTRASA